MERHASPALSSEKRRQHRSRAQTDRREGVKSPFLICSCFIFPFFSFFFLSFWLSVLSFDRRRSDGVVGSGSSSGVPSAVNSDHGIQTHGD